MCSSLIVPSLAYLSRLFLIKNKRGQDKGSNSGIIYLRFEWLVILLYESLLILK